MYYKRDHKIGVRKNFDGKNQVFQFGVKAKTKAQLFGIAQQAVDKLSAGDSIDNVHTWVIAQTENIMTVCGYGHDFRDIPVCGYGHDLYPYAGMVIASSRKS